MKIPETPPTDQTDVENAPGKAEKSILEPLQFLLAARRGVRADPTFTTTNVPDDRALVYAGESGVECLKKTPLWSRILCHCGYTSKLWLLTFWVFYTTFLFSDLVIATDDDDEYTDNFFYRLRLGGYAAAGMVAFLVATRAYAKKRMAAAMPPPFDPASYQSRLVRALEQQGMQFRDVVAMPVGEMEKAWKKDLNVQEKFRIEGLVDVDRESVYDIAVMFWANGNLNLQFGSGLAEDASQNKNGVLLREKVDLI